MTADSHRIGEQALQGARGFKLGSVHGAALGRAVCCDTLDGLPVTTAESRHPCRAEEPISE